MHSNIFINYRKEDSRWNAQALYTELLKYFSKDSIFKDFNTIGLGDDYVATINKALEQCDVLLVLIGKTWLNMKNHQGLLRLHDPNDLVRMEIATAFRRNIKVIPVLFDDVEICEEHELPEDIRPLVRRQYIAIKDVRFESDVQKLAGAIKDILREKKPGPRPETPPTPEQNKSGIKARLRIGALMAVLGLVVSAIAIFLIYSNDQRFGYQGHESLSNITLISAAVAAVLWLIVGLTAGPRKFFLKAVFITSLIALALWLIVYGTYQDVVQSAIIFGMPMGGMLGIFLGWLLKKMIGQPASKENGNTNYTN